MDVNGTRMHLVLGLDDWRSSMAGPLPEGICYDTATETLILRPEPFRFPGRDDPTAPRLLPADRRGAAVDAFGNRYWIGPDRRRILFQMADDRTVYRYWPIDGADDCPESGTVAEAGAFGPRHEPPAGGDLELSGLAITTHQYLIVGLLNVPLDDHAGRSQEDPPVDGVTSGLGIFDLHGGGPPVIVAWPPGIGFRPFDIAGLADGGVVILDVAVPAMPGPARLWQLDRYLRVVDLGDPVTPVVDSPVFVPMDLDRAEPSRSTVYPSSTATDAAQAAVLDTNWAVAVDTLADGSVLVLDRLSAGGGPELSRWRCGRQLDFGIRVGSADADTVDLLCSDQSSNAGELLAQIVGHDIVVLPGRTGRTGEATVFLVDDQGDQAFAFDVFADGAELRAEYHPLRLFSGKALIADGTTAYYDLADRWYPIPSRPNQTYARSGTVVLAPGHGDGTAGRGFDGGLPGTVWHRFVLDGSIPPGCSVRVESRAADDPAVLDVQTWRQEPAPYRRADGSEIPFHRYPRVDASSTRDAVTDHRGSWEFLFQECVGRFLQLRVTLTGDGRRTPRVWALRAHYPRFSYLDRYLPDVYQEDPISAGFLDRYLANVEGLLTTFEGRVSLFQRLLDPDTTDAEFLPWLASWVGGVVESDWSERRRRLFVAYASRMFSRRGTQRGLIEAIRLATDECPDETIFDPDGGARAAFGVRVVEHFRTREAPGVVFGDPTELEGPRLATPPDPASRWTPVDGRARLESRWSDYLQSVAGGGGGAGVPFPTLTPSDGQQADLWRGFVHTELAVNYADVGSIQDLRWWQQFLQSRYRREQDYNTAWMLAGSNQITSFGSVGFPATLPPDGTPLLDWITFVSSSLPIRRNAHRFTVLVPIPLSGTDEERERWLGPVRRVVALNQPAHTIVDVKPYWGEFRVGAARVGLETIVGQSGRYVDMVLGSQRLAYGTIPGGRSWRLEDRFVIGRNRTERNTQTRFETGGST